MYCALLSEHGPALVVRRLCDYLALQAERRVVAPLHSERASGLARRP